MLTKTITIKNPSGLHARPATAFVQKASAYPCNVNLIKGSKKINGKSIMGLMTLAAKQGEELILEVDGPEEEVALDELTKVLEAEHL
ncbi:HPr family phosphocarrier protein [Ammoniphilus resinae]|uniref:Phosphocarrier protein HPr n=1 Tax=Ammoniphilus resinae TaxID=861532 RepID=A0ABS4GWU5_9BACL|nr:HPr family phosphocarrier protein [Ammoniphilus resinae]MBP1934731.1 phosphocarrier protein [Ammoniphilus resinae]